MELMRREKTSTSKIPCIVEGFYVVISDEIDRIGTSRYSNREEAERMFDLISEDMTGLNLVVEKINHLK